MERLLKKLKDKKILQENKSQLLLNKNKEVLIKLLLKNSKDKTAVKFTQLLIQRRDSQLKLANIIPHHNIEQVVIVQVVLLKLAKLLKREQVSMELVEEEALLIEEKEG